MLSVRNYRDFWIKKNKKKGGAFLGFIGTKQAAYQKGMRMTHSPFKKPESL
jgi:hypothetical protein